jgi:hypothetical protein
MKYVAYAMVPLFVGTITLLTALAYRFNGKMTGLIISATAEFTKFCVVKILKFIVLDGGMTLLGSLGNSSITTLLLIVITIKVIRSSRKSS